MAITVKKIVLYRDFTNEYTTEHYKIKPINDYPYMSGIPMGLIPLDKDLRMDFQHIKVSLFNGTGYGKTIVNVGSQGLLYLLLRPEYWLEKIIVEPDDVVADIYYGEKGLIYSFYNPTRRDVISITAKLGEDVEGAYREISSSPDDLHLRQYYVRKAISKSGTSLLQKPVRVYPENMIAKDVAEYLNLEEKTIRNWTSQNKIPFVRLGTAVRYPKNKIDSALEKGEIGRVVKKK